MSNDPKTQTMHRPIRTAVLALSALVLMGCSTRVDLGAAADLAEQDAEIVPRVDTRTAIRTFEKYCYQNRAKPSRVVAAVKQDGYRLLITDRRENMFGYAHPTRPMVLVIDDPAEPACMTMVQRDPNLAAAYTNFVKARHSNARQTSVPDLDSSMVVPGNPSMVFVRDIDGTDELLMMIVQ